MYTERSEAVGIISGREAIRPEKDDYEEISW